MNFPKNVQNVLNMNLKNNNFKSKFKNFRHQYQIETENGEILIK